VIHVVDSGLAGGVDDDVLESARTDGRVLVSSDTDFGELLARAGAALPSLILFGRATGHPSIK
jgi:predicted nuclease of predicted toxin-antitoxin system